MNKYFIVAISLLIAGCFEQKPPKGFEAVIPPEDFTRRTGCPNLIDTYVLTDSKEHNKLLPAPVAKGTFQFLVIDSLVADQAYNYSLHMERFVLIKQAQALKETNPKDYFHWREKNLALKSHYSAQALADVKALGPAVEQRGQFRIYGCAEGWAKVNEQTSSTWDEKDQRHYTRQDDVWLARDQYGDLLVHTVSYQQKPGWTFWAAGGAGVRLIRVGEHWGKITKASDSRISSSWTETDLPAVKKPVEKPGECRANQNELIDLNQSLLAQGFMITEFLLQPPAIKDNACVQPSLILSFSTKSSAEGKQLMQFLESHQSVGGIELLETRMNDSGLHYRLQVTLNLAQE